MADTLDLISLTEAKTGLPGINGTGQDTALASYITAVSRRLDELCGPIVTRTIASEEYDDLGFANTHRIFLRNAPASKTASTTITTVTEYVSGAATVLSAESVTASTANDYRFDKYTGILYRRASWGDTFFAPTVVVTYSPGRYADTASVDVKFKQAASMMLSMLWRRERGGGSQIFGDPGFEAETTAVQGATFAVPNAVKELLADEIRAPVLSGR